MSLIKKIKKLINDPKDNIWRIIPYLESKTFCIKKCVYEKINIDKLSRPYPGHERLLEYIGKKNGFFVECGGNDGFFQDPTYYLEKFMNWRGIIIEPLPIFKKCEKNRKKSEIYNFALVSKDYTDTEIEIIDCRAMSVINNALENQDEWVKEGERINRHKHEVLKVKVSTLDNILSIYNAKNKIEQIDLLVLDTEGYEINILNGFSIKKYKPKHVLIEIHNEKRKKEIDDYLIKNGYTMLDEIGDLDYLYKLI